MGTRSTGEDHVRGIRVSEIGGGDRFVRNVCLRTIALAASETH